MNDKVADLAGRKPKISKESAEAQVESLLDYYDIYPDDFPEGVRDALQASCRKLTRAVMDGRLEIVADDVIKITQQLDGDILEYAEVSGANKAEMGKAGDGDNYSKVYCLVGSLTGVGSAGIKKLKGKHLGLAESLGTLFLQI